MSVLALIEMARSRLRRARQGRLGQRLVTDLFHRLPDTHYVVNDVVLPGVGGNIDHVVIGPCGVVVIETKWLAGTVQCDGDDWYVNGRRRGSVSAQVNRGAAAVREFLMDRHPELRPGDVNAITVFTHPLCRLKISGAGGTVVRYAELTQVLHDMGASSRIPPQVARRLAATLLESQRPEIASSQLSRPVRA